MIPNPWVILAVALAWAASLVSVGYWQREDGKAVIVAEYEKRDNASLTAANETIDRLNREARATEQAHAQQLAAIGEHHANDLRDLETRRRADVRAAHDGALVLRIPGACPPAGASPAGQAPAAPGRGDGPQDAELPGPIAADLLDLANDADRNTIQLAACQAVVLSDRKGDTP